MHVLHGCRHWQWHATAEAKAQRIDINTEARLRDLRLDSVHHLWFTVDYNVQTAWFFIFIFFSSWRAWGLFHRTTIKRKDGKHRFTKLRQQSVVDHRLLHVASSISLAVLQFYPLEM